MNKYYELLKEKEYQKIKEEAIIKNDLDLDYLIVLISASFKTNEFVILYYYLSKTNFKKEIEDGGANYTNYLNYRVIDLLNILFEIGYEDEVLNKIYHLLMSVE